MNLSTNLLLWLGVLSLFCMLVGQALKTNTLDAVLARYNVPPVPKRAIPWLTLLFGVATGFFGPLLLGKDWQTALVTSITGVLGSVFATAGHEMIARDYNGASAADNPAKRGGGSAGGALAGATTAMVVVLAIGASMLVMGCAKFLSSPILPDLQADEQCAVTEIEHGDTDPKQIAKVCFGGFEKTAIDAFVWLLDSVVFTSAHPHAIAPMRAHVAAWRAGHPTAVITPWRDRSFAMGPARPAFSGAF